MKEIKIKDNYELARPTQMTEMAVVLKNHIVKHKLYTDIKGKNYVHVEGWTFAGGMLGLHPIVTEVKELGPNRWMAKTEIVNGKGEILSAGYATCSKLESKKASFDEYAVLSMAQTRSIGKAYRNLIGWVMKMSGYESTPAEEIKSAPTEAEVKSINTKPAIDKLSKATNKVELQNVWRSLSQTERNHPDINDFKDNLKQKYGDTK
jgi:hypothetical protein